jgi:hypothetical protein
MALSKGGLSPRWHFWVRLLGLTGLVVLATGFVLWQVTEEEPAVYAMIAGGVLTGMGVLGELQAAVVLLLSRRGAAGSSALVQILLAAGLFAGLNAFSFFHYARFDCTEKELFTLDSDTKKQLRDLRGETRIVIFERHTSFGQLSDKADQYTAAAERRIVEKVRDLAEQFQELGPRFRVEVLDVQDKRYGDKLKQLREEAPELAEAIDKAPEDSIFFAADGKIQRLAFHDVYQLDKQASQQSNNLVLRDQGVGPFARKVLNIDEKRPRIAVGVIHEMLGLNDDGELGMAGAKKVLAEHGIAGKDIILKKWVDFRLEGPAVLTYDESRYEQLESDLRALDGNLKRLQTGVRETEGDERLWRGPLDTINKEFAVVEEDGDAVLVPRARLEQLPKAVRQKLRVSPVEDEQRDQILELQIRPRLALLRIRLKATQKERDTLAVEKAKLNVEDLTELRRIEDLRAKLSRSLADCDLLIVPRPTLLNIPRGVRIPSWVHALTQEQLDGIKAFAARGKPVLFCLGPTNEPGPERMPPGQEPDRLEDTLAELGFELPRQTVLFNVEAKAFAERVGGLLLLPGASVEVPPVRFDWPPGAELPRGKAPLKPRPPQPIRVSMRLASRSVAQDQPLDLRLRYPRPVYFEPRNPAERPRTDPIFMLTDPEAWNSPSPFPTDKGPPTFEPPKTPPTGKETVTQEREGSFSVALGVEVPVPASWAESNAERAATVRLAVIGHGGVFGGPKLTPAREKLLLDTCNWLLGRDDLLARDQGTWKYPRVELDETEVRLWQWGTLLGMPLVCLYLGVVVLMVRWMR